MCRYVGYYLNRAMRGCAGPNTDIAGKRLGLLRWSGEIPPGQPDECAAIRARTLRKEFMIITTANEVNGRVVSEYLGIVRGIVVRTPTIGQGFLGGLEQILGGNIESYADVCEAAREEAYNRMVQHAEEMGANAIIAMRYDATEFASGATEVLAYGTAVELANEQLN